MEEINRKKAIAAKKKKIAAAAGGRPGKISKDADFVFVIINFDIVINSAFQF